MYRYVHVPPVYVVVVNIYWHVLVLSCTCTVMCITYMYIDMYTIIRIVIHPNYLRLPLTYVYTCRKCTFTARYKLSTCTLAYKRVWCVFAGQSGCLHRLTWQRLKQRLIIGKEVQDRIGGGRRCVRKWPPFSSFDARCLLTDNMCSGHYRWT